MGEALLVIACGIRVVIPVAGNREGQGLPVQANIVAAPDNGLNPKNTRLYWHG